jgi:hypothetical protein
MFPPFIVEIVRGYDALRCPVNVHAGRKRSVCFRPISSPTMRAITLEMPMDNLWLSNYRSWLNAGFDSWDALAYCFHGSADVEVLWDE